MPNNEAHLLWDRGARLLCVLGLLFWSALLTYKYVYFGFYDWDLTLYAQAMQGLTRFTTFGSLYGGSFLVDHAHYIAFVLTPIYMVFPHPLTLVNLELMSFFGGAFLLYTMASRMIARPVAFAVLVAFIIHPANIFMLFYEFHFESLAIGPIFLMFYFWTKERWIPFLITVVIVMLIKENMALLVAMFGVYGLLFKREGKWKWGGLTLALGSIYFLINIFVLLPFLRRDLVSADSMYWSLYSQFGNTPSEILNNVFFNPSKITGVLFSSLNMSYLNELLRPFLFLSLFGPSSLIALPVLAQNILPKTLTMHTIYYHYAATLVPFLAIGAVESLQWLQTKFRPVFFNAVGVLMIVVGIGGAWLYWPAWEDRVGDWVDYQDPVRQSMLEMVPKDAPVVASFSFLNHLTDRTHIYAFYNVWRDKNYFTGQTPFVLPKDLRFALIDLNDNWLLADLRQNPEFTRQALRRFYASRPWTVKARHGRILLLEHKP